jgi:hypothetical protein
LQFSHRQFYFASRASVASRTVHFAPFGESQAMRYLLDA